MNSKQGDQIQFSLEKRLEKRKWIHSLLSNHQQIFSHLSQNVYHATEKKKTHSMVVLSGTY